MPSRITTLVFGAFISTAAWACGSGARDSVEPFAAAGGSGAGRASGGSTASGTGGESASTQGGRGGPAGGAAGSPASGASPAGGASGSGGAQATGGALLTGGASSVGPSADGATAGAVGAADTGGAPQADAGSTQPSGGAAGAEDVPATGGTQSTGGAAPTGGTGGTADATDCDVPPPSNTPIGYGAHTTGGGDAAAISVSTFEEAVAALQEYRDAFKNGTASARVVRYTGTFDYASITDVCAQHSKEAQILYIKEVENVTFEGASGSSANFGIKINRAKNVIVRNMTLGLLPGGGSADAISIEGNGTSGDVENVWIDHNELFSSTKDDCEGAGDTEFDGLIDIKRGARHITISYNYLHDHQKTGLLGSSDSDDTDRYVTFHHNWYENVVSRTPLQRFGYTHLFNNYYDEILSSGINVRMGGIALIEANYFENAANPVTSRYSDEAGYWDLRNNYVGEGISWTTESDTLANAEDWQTTKAFPPSELGYSYAPDPAPCVKAIVMATAGATL